MSLINEFLDLSKEVFNNGIFGISLYNFGIFVLSIIFAILIRSFFASLIVSKLKKMIKKTSNTIDDSLFDSLIPPIKLLPVVLVFLSIGLYYDIQSTFGLYLQKINKTLTTLFIFWLLHQSLIPLSNFFYKFEEILSKAFTMWLIRSIKYLILFLGAVAILEVWGIKVGPVIAGLGLFGVAIALGAQDLFKNLISGIMILLERRFQIGDVINLPGHCEGTVEHIGFRSTLIRKFDSTPMTIPNHIFAEAPILNYSNRTNWRINWVIGLEYNSTLDQIKSFTLIISQYIKNSNDFLVNENFKSFVRLDKFNDSSVDILVYCFTATNDWEEFLKIKENLALKIKQEVEKIGLSFAYPSQSVYIENLSKEDISKIWKDY